MFSTEKLFLFIGMLIIPLITNAQESGYVKIDSKKVIIDGNELSVDLVILGNYLDIKQDGLYKVEVSLMNGDNLVSLPSVLYTNTSHYHYDKDRKTLYSTKLNDVQIVDLYRLVKGVNKYNIYWMPYAATVSYEPWMKDAVLKVKCISQCPQTNDVLLIEETMRAEL